MNHTYKQGGKKGMREMYIYIAYLFPPEEDRSFLSSDFPVTRRGRLSENVSFVSRAGYFGALMITVVPHSATVGVVLKRARHARSFFPRKLRIRRSHDEWQFHKAISAVRYQSLRCNRHDAIRLRLRYDFPAITSVL